MQDQKCQREALLPKKQLKTISCFGVTALTRLLIAFVKLAYFRSQAAGNAETVIPVLGHIILISSAPSVGSVIVDVHHVNVFV